MTRQLITTVSRKHACLSIRVIFSKVLLESPVLVHVEQPCIYDVPMSPFKVSASETGCVYR